MTKPLVSRSFEVRHVQLARAAFAAIAAIMVTFSPDHSAVIGLSIFSGFALSSAIVLFAGAWWAYPAGQKWPSVTLGTMGAIAGLAAGVPALRTVPMYFVIVIAWALATGLVETIAGARRPRTSRTADTVHAARSESRDGLTVGVLTLVLGVGLLFVPTQYALSYTIQDADATFTLTGIVIGVGIFGGYCAVVAVYLAIAGLSPRKPASQPVASDDADHQPTDAPRADSDQKKGVQ